MNDHTRQVLADERTEALANATRARELQAKAQQQLDEHTKTAERFEDAAAQITADLVVAGGIRVELAKHLDGFHEFDQRAATTVDRWIERELAERDLQPAPDPQTRVETGHQPDVIRGIIRLLVQVSMLAVPR